LNKWGDLMKKTIKKLLVIALAVGMCFVLCSCDFIREMRKSWAYYTDETKEKIIFHDKIYLPIDDERLEEYFIKTDNLGSVSQKDVPLLLSSVFGDEMWYNSNKTIIEAVRQDSENEIYCREDYVDELMAFLDNPVMDRYCFDAIDFETLEFETKVLSEDAVKLINDIILTGKPYEDNYDYDDINYIVMLDECDKDGTFTNGYINVWEMTDGRYVIYTSVYRDGNSEYEDFCIDVPKENSLLFKEIFELSGYSEEVELW